MTVKALTKSGVPPPVTSVNCYERGHAAIWVLDPARAPLFREFDSIDS